MSDPRFPESSEKQSSGSQRACQPMSVWLQICSGALADNEAMKHLQHAAECRDCSNLLAEANACLSEDPTPEEEAILSMLSTTSLPGQFRLAARMQDAVTRARQVPKTSHSHWKISLPLIASLLAAACLIAAASLFVFRTPTDDTLLARAYDQQRPSALRLPGTRPGPLASPTRGGTNSTESSDLLELELHTQKQFESHPNDPKVRQRLGRIALVQHQGENALRNFEIAEGLDPKLPGLSFDKAAAHFELAESTSNPLEYGIAAQLFASSGASDPVTLFNEALCWERVGNNPQAATDFQKALAAETDPKWRQEIQSHLAKLKQDAAAELTPAALQQRLTPAAFLASQQDPPGYFELLLGVASREWLPQRGASAQIDAALSKLAVLDAAHDDHWINDMLRAPVSEKQRAADIVLSQALTASSAGNADQALAQSKAAMLAYSISGNRAGYLRAAAEHVYTLQRMGLDRDSLREAAALTNDPQLSRYAWLSIYLQLEVSAAYGMQGDLAKGRIIASAAASAATRAGLPLSFLRATSFVVNAQVEEQHYIAAWDEATSGLQDTAPVLGAAMPRFQLFYGLTGIAKALDLHYAQAALAEAAAVVAKNTPNQQTAAYAMEKLALADLQIGDLAGASHSFQQADRLLASLGDGSAKRRYAADWKTDRILLTARTLGPAAAVSSLAQDEADYQQVDAALPRLHFYTVYADLLRQANDTPGSVQKALIAITDAEHQLAAFHTKADRQGWPEETRRAYEILVADLADSTQDPALSLRAWEWLQSAPSREGRPFSIARISPDQLDNILPTLPPEPSGHLTVVVAKVLDRYILWSIRSDPQQPVTRLTLAAATESIAHRSAVFLRLCSDPHSAMEDVNVLGDGLYRDLLGPLDDQIAQADELDLDLDTSLAQLPLSALLHRGRYLGLEHSLKLLPAGWSADYSTTHHDLAHDPERLPPETAFVVLKQSAQDNKPLIPSDYDESATIARLFAHAQLRSATLSRSGPDLSLSGPHDLPALLSHAVVVHYVGHGLDDAPPQPVTSPDPVLKLSNNSLPHCRLAVLAACQTLREREELAEDVPSFARIIRAAGAGNVLASQWDVDSRSTSQLMQHFYTNLAAHQTFSEALRRAQQSLESDPSSAHPYFWSGFQLVGD